MFLFGGTAHSQERSTQMLQATLPQILSISKIIVEHADYNPDSPLPNVRITGVNKSVRGQNTINLSPMQVQIHTNMATPINVTAHFDELKHTGNQYNFPSVDLFFSPGSYTINNPHDEIITSDFIPQAVVHSNVIAGTYEGKVTFTLGAI